MLRMSGKTIMIVGFTFIAILLIMVIVDLSLPGENIFISTIMLWFWLGSLAFTGLGVWLWVMGGKKEREAIDRRQFMLRQGKQTEGEVVFTGSDYQFTNNGRPAFGLAVVKYQDDYGQTRELTVKELDLKALGTSGLKPGDKVQVYYLNVAPDQAIFLLPGKHGPEALAHYGSYSDQLK